MNAYARALALAGGLLLAFCVQGQTIYKCPRADGTYAYTDVKCSGPGATVVRQAGEPDPGAYTTIPAATLAQLSRMSLRELYARTQALSARERVALAEVRRERKARGARAHAPLPDPAAGVAGKTWESKLLVAHTKLNQMVIELRRRCPGGAAMAPQAQSCHK